MVAGPRLCESLLLTCDSELSVSEFEGLIRLCGLWLLWLLYDSVHPELLDAQASVRRQQLHAAPLRVLLHAGAVRREPRGAVGALATAQSVARTRTTHCAHCAGSALLRLVQTGCTAQIRQRAPRSTRFRTLLILHSYSCYLLIFTLNTLFTAQTF